MGKILAFFRNLIVFFKHQDEFIQADQEEHDKIIHNPEK